MYSALDTACASEGQALGVPAATRPFRSGMFDCYSDTDSCCFGLWCNPCLYGVNVKTAQVS